MQFTPHHEIYGSYASTYDLLRSRMDYQGNLKKAMFDLAPFPGADVVEMAAGTGMLTSQLLPM